MTVVEAYVVRIDKVGGVRNAQRHSLQVPFDAAIGAYERLSERALTDLLKDLNHEQMRRQGWT